MDIIEDLLREMTAQLTEVHRALGALSVEVKELKTDLSKPISNLNEVDERLDRVDERLDYLAVKWMDQDEAIYKLKRRLTRPLNDESGARD